MAVTSTSVTISWEEDMCTGGHTISDFNIRYAEPASVHVFYYYYYYYDYYYDYFFTENTYIRGISGNQRNYTIIGLSPSTTYQISIQAVSVDTTSSSYSPKREVTTLSPGEH